jgi:hypothetical protein
MPAKNVKMTISGTGKSRKLVIECDISKSFGKSKSGSSEMFATTAGNIDVPDTDLKLGLNLYKPVE